MSKAFTGIVKSRGGKMKKYLIMSIPPEIGLSPGDTLICMKLNTTQYERGLSTAIPDVDTEMDITDNEIDNNDFDPVMSAEMTEEELGELTTILCGACRYLKVEDDDPEGSGLCSKDGFEMYVQKTSRCLLETPEKFTEREMSIYRKVFKEKKTKWDEEHKTE